MPKTRTLLQILAGALVVLSCTYKFDEKYINPVEPPLASIVVNLVLEDPDDFSSPYFLDQSTNFVISIAGNSKPVSHFEVLVNGSQLSSASMAEGKLVFTLVPQTLGTGTHKIDIVLHIKSGTGSLADVVGAEYYLIERTFSVVVDLVPPTTTSPLTASLIDGYLHLNWSMSKPNDYKYMLSKYKMQAPLFQKEFVSISTFNVGDATQTIDSGFVGGRYFYELRLLFAGNQTLVGTVEFRKSPADFVIQTGLKNSRTLTWTPHFAHANLTFVRSTGSEEMSLDAGQVALDTLFLGDQRTYRVFVRRNNYPLQAYDTTIMLQANSNLPPFNDLRINTTLSKLLLFRNNDIHRHHWPTLVFEDKFTNHSPLSVLQSIVTGAPSGDILGGNTVIINPANMSQFRGFRPTLPDGSGGYMYAEQRSISSAGSNGLLGMSIVSNGSPRAALGDLTIDTQVDPHLAIVWMDSVNNDMPLVSPLGEYFVLNHPDASYARVFKKVAGTWTEQGRLPTSVRYFRGGNSKELIIIGSSIMIYDISQTPGAGVDYTLVRTFAIPAFPDGTLTGFGYDPLTEFIWMVTISPDYYSTIRTYSVDDFTLQERAVAFTPPASPLPIRHVYSNHYHFLTSGYAEAVNP